MASPWRISPLQAPELGRAVEVPAEGITVGRDPSNGLVVPGSLYPGVSSHHARLTSRDEGLFLEDLGSKNGTLVHGEAVEGRFLRGGDVFQLGPGGPRFLVLSSERMEETLAIPKEGEGGGGEKERVGSGTTILLRQRLGLPEGIGVDQLVRRRTRRATIFTIAAVLLAVAGVASAFWLFRGRDRADLETLRAQAGDLERRFAAQVQEAKRAIESQRHAWDLHASRLEEARATWVADKAALQTERDRLEEGIRRLAEDEKAAADELERLQARLEETRKSLERYDPVNLEQARLREVSRVEESVVLVEARQILRERESGRILHFEREEGEEETPRFNVEDRGEAVSREATGSGFCVSPDGWILTNAHVVFEEEDGEEARTLRIGPDMVFVPDVEIDVVFSGHAERRAARLVRAIRGEWDDLALLRIESFEEMPHLAAFDVDLPMPPRGTEVFLLGFPLGTRVLQRGDVVVASAFRGIVSRDLDVYLQVDAAVHPGASGGPVIDNAGRLLGIVTAMQVTDPAAASSAIGYVLPVRDLRKIWPPADEGAAAPTGSR